MEMATLFIKAFYLYCMLGCVFASWFVLRGAGKLDHDAQKISWLTRLLFFPGSVALWPVLALKLMYTRPENPANKH
jgi:hypothetical protein